MGCVVDKAYETFVHKINAKGEIISAELIYLVFFDDNASELDALEAVREVAPDNVGSAKVQSFEIDEMLDLANYKVKVEYAEGGASGNSEQTVIEASTISFNCGGGTRHVNQAYSQKHISAEGATSVDIGNGINWNGQTGEDADFAGIDVPSAELQETYTKVMKRSALTTAFRRKVANLVGCANSAVFKGWSAGEVLFLGCSFSGVDKNSEEITVNFNFSIKPNETSAYIGGLYVGTVRGWDYVWTLKPKMTWSKDSLQTKIEHVFVAQVVPYRSFAGLGL